jgi:hypothetical protein
VERWGNNDMKRVQSDLRTQLTKQPIGLVITGLLLAGIAHGLSQMFGLALAHWQQPNLFGDSFTFVIRDHNNGLLALLGWLTAQHNEHRIIWAKAASVLETELFNLPPGQSALFQNLVLILACAGLWSWICRRLLQRPDLQLITALSGWLLLLNPWQYENLGWEFQTPWFLINALVLLGSLLLSISNTERSSFRSKLQTVLLMLLPWIALAGTGQGVALAVALACCSWLRSRRLGALVSGSTALAGICFFVLLPYSKPANHPDLSFQLDYFLRAWLGGQWQGLAVLSVVIAAVLLGRRQAIRKTDWPALLMPGLFSLLFAGMITLSRAGFGLEQANTSRYVTHSVMLGLTALLALALIDDRSRRAHTPLLGAFLVLITTLGSFPQGFQANGLSYSGAWTEGQRWAEQKRQGFLCHAERVGLAAQNIRLMEPCKEIEPLQRIADRYFQGGWPVKPLGWHQRLIASSGAGGPIRHKLDQQTLKPVSVQLRGWAFQVTAPNQQLYLLATYGADEQLAIPINQARHDVKRAHDLSNVKVGFDAVLPRTVAGQRLRIVRVGTVNNNVQIWEDPSVNG